MLNRNFNEPVKSYINKNKFSIIIVALILLLGLLCGCIFGFNGNFEVAGYNEFTVAVGNANSNTIKEYKKNIKNIVNSQGGNFDNAIILGEGENTKLVVRYMNALTNEKQTQVNNAVLEILKIENPAEDAVYVSNHVAVSSVVKASDIIYTTVAILLLVVVASLFAYFRYNGASAISIILSCLIGSALYLSVSTILRLEIGMSYFAMLVILNLLICYLCFTIFEHIREENWLSNKDYSIALNSALKGSRARVLFVNIALLVLGLLCVIVAPVNIKYVALNVMFMPVAILAIVWYIMPFIWSMFITHTKLKNYKKPNKTESSNEDIK